MDCVKMLTNTLSARVDVEGKKHLGKRGILGKEYWGWSVLGMFKAWSKHRDEE